jgi:hypothetical protein
VIAYRHVDPRYPFLWESADQPAARWHGEGEGPAHYFADTPEGAWAEFLRHEGISDAEDIAGVRRAMWAVEIPEALLATAARPSLSARVLSGGLLTYGACRRAARALRRAGATALLAPSAALRPGGAGGWRIDGGFVPGPARDGRVVVLYGRQPLLVGWSAVHIGQPDARILARVNPL